MPSRKSADPNRLVSLLLTWFASNARDLPWRHTLDPYAIWISEVMLQQTQVKTVIPYWKRWLKALPTVKALAEAPEDRVLKLWEGLGYYSRARNLQAAAQIIVTEHRGLFPSRLPDLLDLPGIGRYTAGALASIAFNQPAPVLDGNVIRVLTRIRAWPGDPREKLLNQKLWELAGQLVAEAQKSDVASVVFGQFSGACSMFNQALMELGATLCTPRVPACRVCPLGSICRAYQQGRPEDYPETGPRPAISTRHFVVAVLKRKERFLLRQRPAGGVNAALWEFPNLELRDASTQRLIAAAEWLGLPPSELRTLARISHSITRYRNHLEVYSVDLGRRRLKVETGAKWVTVEELQLLALTSAHRRIARTLETTLVRPFVGGLTSNPECSSPG